MVNKVEYETKDRTNWKAIILSYDMQGAINYLIKNVKDYDRYVSTQIIGAVDVIAKDVFDDYFISNETKVVETVVKEVPAEVGEILPSCPWCDKEFKTKQTLGTHIKKYHMGD